MGSLVRRGQCVLELGAGLGLVGLLVAALGFAAANFLTDGDGETLCRLCENLRRNDMMEKVEEEDEEGDGAVDGGAEGIRGTVGKKMTIVGQRQESVDFVEPRRFTGDIETKGGAIGEGMPPLRHCNRRDATVAR